MHSKITYLYLRSTPVSRVTNTRCRAQELTGPLAQTSLFPAGTTWVWRSPEVSRKRCVGASGRAPSGEVELLSYASTPLRFVVRGRNLLKLATGYDPYRNEKKLMKPRREFYPGLETKVKLFHQVLVVALTRGWYYFQDVFADSWMTVRSNMITHKLTRACSSNQRNIELSCGVYKIFLLLEALLTLNFQRHWNDKFSPSVFNNLFSYISLLECWQ